MSSLLSWISMRIGIWIIPLLAIKRELDHSKVLSITKLTYDMPQTIAKLFQTGLWSVIKIFGFLAWCNARKTSVRIYTSPLSGAPRRIPICFQWSISTTRQCRIQTRKRTWIGHLLSPSREVRLCRTLFASIVTQWQQKQTTMNEGLATSNGWIAACHIATKEITLITRSLHAALRCKWKR